MKKFLLCMGAFALLAVLAIAPFDAQASSGLYQAEPAQAWGVVTPDYPDGGDIAAGVVEPAIGGGPLDYRSLGDGGTVIVTPGQVASIKTSVTKGGGLFGAGTKSFS